MPPKKKPRKDPPAGDPNNPVAGTSTQQPQQTFSTLPCRGFGMLPDTYGK